MSQYIHYIAQSTGGGGGGVTTLNGLSGALTLSAGAGITITPSGSTLTIDATGAAPAWGDITGTLSDQTDLQNALDAKANIAGQIFTGAISATNLSGTNTGDVTLGTANGLSLLGQALSLDLSSASTTGSLSSTDWSTFNTAASSVAAATSAETPDTLVLRDGSAGFEAGVVQLLSNTFQFGTVDPFGRTQIWNYAANASLRLGSWGLDGDPTNSSSQGIVVYGDSIAGTPISDGPGGAGSYARIKNNRLGLYDLDPTLPGFTAGAYYFRVDDTQMFYVDNAGVTTFSLQRATGAIKTSMGAGVVVSDSSGNLTSTAPGTAGNVLTSDGSAWISSASSAAYEVDVAVLSGTDITNGFITLSSTPSAPTVTALTVIGGPMQEYGADYTISGATLSWTGLFLDGVLVAGDTLIIQFK